jgi:hypothetical protein
VALPYSLDDAIRAHDAAIADWLGTYLVDYGTINGQDRDDFPILRVMASPHRAFAATADMLVAQGWITDDDPKVAAARATYEWPVLPLPVISFERDNPTISNELANSAGIIRKGTFDPATGEWQAYQYPTHYVTVYRATLWSEKKYTQADFTEWVLSQLGTRGAGPLEMYLSVNHGPVVGSVAQALRYTGAADMSDLEGNDARHMRTQFQFVLRSWLWRAPPALGMSAPPVHTIVREAEATNGAWQETQGSAATCNLFTTDGWTSKNIDVWPHAGTGSASEPTVQGLTADLPAEHDMVELVQVDAVNDALGRAYWSVALSYSSDAPFTVRFSSFDVDLLEYVVQDIACPAGTNTFHRFFVSTGRRSAVSLVNTTGVGSTVKVYDVDIRQVAVGDRALPTRTGDVFTWSSVERRQFLAVAMLDDTNVASGTAALSDDASTPDNTRTESVAGGATMAVAMLTMPKTDSFSLSLPAGILTASVYAVAFDGPFNGSTV